MDPFLGFALKYWRETLIILLLSTAAASWYSDRSSLIKSFDKATERYEKELATVKESHAREVERQEKVLKEYQKKVSEIERDYAAVQDELQDVQDSRVGEIVRLRSDDPKKLATQIEEAFGFEYVK
jgi:TolA-binding protein